MGTDLELREDKETLENLAKVKQRPISYSRGLELQKKIGAEKYCECSARTLRGVNSVFDEAILAALEPPARNKTKRAKSKNSAQKGM